MFFFSISNTHTPYTLFLCLKPQTQVTGEGLLFLDIFKKLFHFFHFQLDRLADPQVWLDAATQIFYSFGLGFGGLVAFSSYNDLHNNCQRDAIMISMCNWFTALFASTVIFAVLGFKATLMFESCNKQYVIHSIFI